MIDFSRYQELPEFIIHQPELNDTSIYNYTLTEPIFFLKSKKYLEKLIPIEEKLITTLEFGIAGYISETDDSIRNSYSQKFNDTKLILDSLLDKISSRFDLNHTKCLIPKTTDYVYDFYRNFLSYLSQVSALSLYEYYYEPNLQKAYEVCEQLFLKIGTGAQLYGIYDNYVNDICNAYNGYLYNWTNKWTDILTFYSSKKTAYLTWRSGIEDNLAQVYNDMTSILNPVVEFINLVKFGSFIANNSMGLYDLSDGQSNLLMRYATANINHSDRFIRSSSTTAQITKHFIDQINAGKDFEMMFTKATKISLNKEDITNTLIDLQTKYIVPNYA